MPKNFLQNDQFLNEPVSYAICLQQHFTNEAALHYFYCRYLTDPTGVTDSDGPWCFTKEIDIDSEWHSCNVSYCDWCEG